MATCKKKRPKAFESSNPCNDVSAVLYASMLQSPAWRKLTKPQQILYVYMRLQFYGNNQVPGKPQIYFYFNQTLWKNTYKLYTNLQSFYRDRDALIEHGFIEMLESGKNTRTKAIYMLSSKWQRDS